MHQFSEDQLNLDHDIIYHRNACLNKTCEYINLVWNNLVQKCTMVENTAKKLIIITFV